MILLFLMILIGVVTVTLQNYFCKNLFKTRSDNFAYSIVVYIIAAVTSFLISGCKLGSVSAFTVLDSLGYGLMLTLELYCTLQAYKYGSMSLTSMFIMASIIIPIVPSWVIWGDSVTWQQIAGIVVMLAAIALILNVGADLGQSGISRKWFLYSLLAFIGSGMAAICEKILTESEHAGETNAFVIIGLFFAAVTMGIMLLILTKVKKEPVTIELKSRIAVPTLGIGIGNSLICLMTMWVLAVLPASVVFTLNNGARLILVTLIDVCFFKEKITKLQYLGLGLGVIGVILLSV